MPQSLVAPPAQLTYSSLMSEQSDKQRITDLEAEVEQLRAKVSQRADASDDSTSVPISETAAGAPSLTKVVALGAIVVVLALAFFLAIYTAMSKGFDSLAHKAASTYTSDMTDEEATSDSPRPAAPQPQPKPAPRVPGL